MMPAAPSVEVAQGWFNEKFPYPVLVTFVARTESLVPYDDSEQLRVPRIVVEDVAPDGSIQIGFAASTTDQVFLFWVEDMALRHWGYSCSLSNGRTLLIDSMSFKGEDRAS